MSMASTISGTMCSASDCASCSTLLPIGLVTHASGGLCDISVIFSSPAGASGTSIGYRRNGRDRQKPEEALWSSSATKTESRPGWTLGSTDLAKSREFYGALFGWNCPEGPPEAGGYSVCDLDGKTVAGLGPHMNPDMPPVWMTYVNVDSADATVAKGAANGGTVFVPPMDVMDAGRMAVFADPVGAVIGLWQPGQHTGAQVANEPGTYCWSELITTDLDASKAFYGAVFGWGAEDQGPPGGPPAYTEWKLAGGRSAA